MVLVSEIIHGKAVLISDSNAREMHLMAHKIRISKRSLQQEKNRHPYYMLTNVQRDQALSLGAFKSSMDAIRKIITKPTA